MTSYVGLKKSHSLRVHDEVWAAAVQRAASEGHTINGILEGILEGYAQGLINMPVITKDYSASTLGTLAPEIEREIIAAMEQIEEDRS